MARNINNNKETSKFNKNLENTSNLVESLITKLNELEKVINNQESSIKEINDALNTQFTILNTLNIAQEKGAKYSKETQKAIEDSAKALRQFRREQQLSQLSTSSSKKDKITYNLLDFDNKTSDMDFSSAVKELIGR